MKKMELAKTREFDLRTMKKFLLYDSPAALVFSSLLLKKSLCGWVCPVGTLSELFGQRGQTLIKEEPLMNAVGINEKLNQLCTAILGLLIVICSLPNPALAVKEPVAAVSTQPGTLVRWSVPGTTRCRMQQRSWPALGETCYYPIDLLQKPGIIEITRWGQGPGETAHISVEPDAYETEEVELGDIPQANPSANDLKRAARERVRLNKAWARKEGPAKFTLALGPPALPLPEGKSFGVKRIFNGKPAAQPHTGADYAAPEGTEVMAVADGTVVMAEDMFFTGNAVFIDHGDGLISMYFHLSEIRVKAEQQVSKGDTLGLVGTTGRSTGPHLFFGVRWHGARINPRFLLEDPAKIPSVARE